jgi:hypothetical protein
MLLALANAGSVVYTANVWMKRIIVTTVKLSVEKKLLGW